MAIKLKINRDACIGCGACTAVMPDLFEIDDEGKASIKGGTVKGKFSEKIISSKASDLDEAVSACPVEAVTTDEVKK